jgi:hypothetical protein
MKHTSAGNVRFNTSGKEDSFINTPLVSRRSALATGEISSSGRDLWQQARPLAAAHEQLL